MEPLRLNVQFLSRKKIWEIDDCYRCALIGTCLTRGELRKLSQERVFAVESGCDDYQLHSRFIGISEQSDLKGKALHKYLEKKYRAVTKKYLRATRGHSFIRTFVACSLASIGTIQSCSPA